MIKICIKLTGKYIYFNRLDTNIASLITFIDIKKQFTTISLM